MRFERTTSRLKAASSTIELYQMVLAKRLERSSDGLKVRNSTVELRQYIHFYLSFMTFLFHNSISFTNFSCFFRVSFVFLSCFLRVFHTMAPPDGLEPSTPRLRLRIQDLNSNFQLFYSWHISYVNSPQPRALPTELKGNI